MLNIEPAIIDNVEFKEETQNIQYLSIHFIDISDDSKSVQSKNERRLFFSFDITVIFMKPSYCWSFRK